MYKSQHLPKPDGPRLSFHKQLDNKDRLIFKVIEKSGPTGKHDPLRRSMQVRSGAITNSKLTSETMKLPLMYQSGSNLQTEEGNGGASQYQSMKKTSFDIKKRHNNTDE